MARSPASPPAPLSPLTVTLYKGGSDDTPPTPGRDPPPTPTDVVHGGVRVNHVTSVVSYDAHNTANRPMAFNTCPTAIMTHLNHGRRTQAFTTNTANTNTNRTQAFNTNTANTANTNNKNHQSHYDPKVSSFDDCEDNVYVNVPSERSHDHSHVYVNLQDKMEGPIVPPRPSLTLPPPSSAMVDEGVCCGSGSSNSGTNTTDTDHHNSQLNYVIVELEVNSDSSAVPPQSPPGSITSGLESPNRTTEGYTQIDFIKTAAISSCTTNANPTLEVGCSRKTRHNSTFANPVVLTRHNSSLSD